MEKDSFNIIVITQPGHLAPNCTSHRYCPVKSNYSYVVSKAQEGIGVQVSVLAGCWDDQSFDVTL